MAVTAFWKLDDNAASTTVVATTGSNGTLGGGDNTADKAAAGPGGSVASSFLLNGVDDKVTISGINIASGSAGSFECFFKVGTLGTNMSFLGVESSTAARLSIFSDTVIRVRPLNTDMDFTVPSLGTAWHHLLVTKTTGNVWRVFIDGVESSTSGITTAQAWAPTRIGVGSGSVSSQWWNGNLAWYRFYDSDESANAATLAGAGADVPVITTNSGDPLTVEVLEGTTAVTTIAASGSGVSYSLSGADSALFAINSSSGVVTFSVAPDFDDPDDANVDNDYEITVTATNVSGSDSIAVTVTVTDYPTTKISLLRHAIRTTTGDDDYTITGLGTADRIKAAFRWGNIATANNTPVDGAHYGFGVFTPAVKTRSVAGRMEHNATTDTEGHVSLGYWRKITALNATEAASTLTNFITDGIRAAVDPAPAAAYLDHIMMFAGDDVEAEIVGGIAADQGDNVEYSLSFTPTLLIILRADDAWDASASHQGFAPHTITFASRQADGTLSVACHSIAAEHVDSTTTNCFGSVTTKSVYWDPARDETGPESEYTISFPDATTLRITTDVHRGLDNEGVFAVLALRFGDRAAQVGIATLGTSAGVQALSLSPAFGFTPDTFCCLPSRITAVDTDRIGSAEAGVAGVAAVTRPAGFAAGQAEYCSTIAIEHGAATTNTQSLTSAKLIAIPDHQGANLVEATFDSFGVGAVNVNVTAAPGTAIKMPFFAISNAPYTAPSTTGYKNMMLLGVG